MVRTFRIAVAALVVAAASATHPGHLSATEHFHDNADQGSWRHHQLRLSRRHSFMRRHLRICNAYPDSRPMDVSRGSEKKLTDGAPMQYKSCRDFLLLLHVGDKLEFKLGGSPAGMFVVQTLPHDHDGVILLVIQRHDTVSTAVSFQSHIFSSSTHAQVAVIDAYKGGARSVARVTDKRQEGRLLKSKALRWSSLVALGQGEYGVNLTSGDGRTLRSSELVALDRENYVVLRTGVDPEDGEAYPQELVIYPNSELPKQQQPSAASAHSWLGGLLAAAALHVLALAAP